MSPYKSALNSTDTSKIREWLVSVKQVGRYSDVTSLAGSVVCRLETLCDEVDRLRTELANR